LKTRPMDRPVHRPNPTSTLLRRDEKDGTSLHRSTIAVDS
jgi:hypothetical protein